MCVANDEAALKPRGKKNDDGKLKTVRVAILNAVHELSFKVLLDAFVLRGFS